MIRSIALSFLLIAFGCAGGDGAPPPIVVPEAPAAPPAPPIVPAPRFPAVEGEVLGFPGATVPGLDASYVWTGLGWLGSTGDVVFEAVIRWRSTLELGCGILRRKPDGTVNLVLMQGQPLASTGGGSVRHPRLPLEAHGDTLVIPALVEGGTIAQGLFAVPRSGGAPVLLASPGEGDFAAAEILPDGTVLAEVVTGSRSTILIVPPGGEAGPLCSGCEPGFSTDGSCVVVRREKTAWAVDFDGVETPLLGTGDPAPGTAGSVVLVSEAWVNARGDFVLHARTDDPERPDVLVRLAGGVEVLAACGAPAPGTGGAFAEILPAAGRSGDVLFGAAIDGDPERAAGVFRARPGEPAELLVASGAAAPGLPGQLGLSVGDVVAGADGRVAFGAVLFENGLAQADGVFVADPAGPRRILTTDAPVEEGTLIGFLYPLREAIHVGADGRTLVHVGIRQDRRPDAILGALLLVE